jgi:hypothetical protein
MERATQPSVVREGITAGILGASTVAIWFLIVDIAAGHPFSTPAVLGHALFGIIDPASNASAAAYVAGYTVFHYLAFCGLGVGASYLAGVTDRVPSALAGLAILFVVFQVAFYGATAILATSLLGSLAWWSVGCANLLAAGSMGLYVYRHHPGMGRSLDYALSGRE